MSADVTTTAPGAVVEVATWCPVEVVDVDGWRAGFSGGFTRRANSVLPERAPVDTDAAFARAEHLYAERGQPARFRVCAAARPDDLDARLAARGYQLAATTHVLVMDVPTGGCHPGGAAGAAPVLSVADEPDDAWLSGWLDVKATGRGVDRGLARAVVAGSPASYVTARDADGVVGVIRAGHAGDWVALSCLMVVPRARRRGLARRLTMDALQLGVEHGARRAFLQAEASNGPAIGLYEQLGFGRATTYHYRER